MFVLNFGFYGPLAFAQNDPELIAKDLVKNEQYEKAIPYFEDLVNLYPKDKVLNYYLGMCLAETEQFSAEAKKALVISLGDNTPKKSLYYLAECFHAENNFTQALNYYQEFVDEARKKDRKETRVDELMKLCEQEINPFSKTLAESPSLPKKPVPVEDTTVEITEIPDSVTVIHPEVIEIPESLQDSLINFQVNSIIKYLKVDQFRNQASLQNFIQAWQAEQQLNELLKKTNQLRDEYDSAIADQKNELADKILQLEKEEYATNQVINQNYTKARAAENSYWEQASAQSIQAFADRIHFMEDSINQAKEIARIKKLEAEKPLVMPDSLIKTLLPEETITQNKGVTYKIQIGAYSKTPPDWVQRLFKKLSVIRRIDQYTDENGVTVYTVGELKSYEDALQMQSQVRMEGVKDAFVAAYQDGKRIPVKEARKMTE